MIHIVRWDASANKAEAVSAEDLPATHADIGDRVYWIDLDNPTAEEEERVFQVFHPVHPLTLEDVTKPRRTPEEGAHLPKVEEFADYLFVIVNPLPPDVCRVKVPLSPGGEGDTIPPIPPPPAALGRTHAQRPHHPPLRPAAVHHRRAEVPVPARRRPRPRAGLRVPPDP